MAMRTIFDATSVRGKPLLLVLLLDPSMVNITLVAYDAVLATKRSFPIRSITDTFARCSSVRQRRACRKHSARASLAPYALDIAHAKVRSLHRKITALAARAHPYCDVVYRCVPCSAPCTDVSLWPEQETR